MVNGNPNELTITDEFALKIKREHMRDKITNYAPVMVLASLIVVLSFLCPPGSFASLSNVTTILNQLAIPLLISIGLTFVIILGSIDLSIDGVVGMSGSILSVLVLNSKATADFGLFGVLLAVLSCVITGAIIGFIHVKGKIPSFMVSFGVCYVAMGIGILSYGGLPATITDPFLIKIPFMQFLGIPAITWVALFILFVAYLIQEHTAFGRYIYAVGTDESIPRSAGVNVDNVKIKVFIFAGLCFGIAGALGAIRLGQGQINIGKGVMFPAQAAVVVGGTALSGGKGGVLNTLVGALIMTVLENGLVLLGVNPYIKTGTMGFILLIAVALTVKRGKDVICK